MELCLGTGPKNVEIKIDEEKWKEGRKEGRKEEEREKQGKEGGKCGKRDKEDRGDKIGRRTSS